jgi:hypothetical protein
MAPSLITSYNVNSVLSGSGDSATLTTTSFTPSNGEVIIVKGQTWGGGLTLATPTGGSQTYTSRGTINPGGINTWGNLWTCVISGSPGSMTIGCTVSGSCVHSLTVERWSGAQLAGSPVVVTASSTSASTATTTLTTAADNSVISTLNGDGQSVAPGVPTYQASGVQTGLANGAPSANSVQYFWYQACGTAGSQTVGISSPTGQKWALIAIEIQPATSASPPGPQTLVVPQAAVMQAANW